MQVLASQLHFLASQLHFLANKNAELAIQPLFWPVNCIKIGGHVALLSDPTVYSLYCVTKCGIQAISELYLRILYVLYCITNRRGWLTLPSISRESDAN